MFGEATTNAAYQGPACDQERPYFSRLSDIENELTRSADLMEEFIARCRGGGIANAATKGGIPIASGHFATVERIAEQMVRIDKFARELSTIG